MSSLSKLKENWEGYAQVDPLWAICTDSVRRGNKWTREEFLATGVTEIGRVMAHVRSLGLDPDPASSALDFGCGVGRLTRALNDYFPECWGVDISPTMVRLAGEFNRDRDGCHFELNQRDDLRMFPDEHFGFIYTSIVLQHIPPGYVERYLAELIRVLKAGGIFVFQVPERQKTPWVYKLGNKVGFRRKVARLRGRRDLDALQMEMHCIPEKHVRAFLSPRPVRLIDVRLTNSSDSGFNGNLQFLEREPEWGFVSKQYCLVKNERSSLPALEDQKIAAT